MSWEAMKAMREHSRARSTTKAIGVAVASYANVETGLAYPGNEDLMRWGWGERTIQDSLRQLEALGEIERVPEMEDARRPRVYRLPLAGQISMLDTGGALASAGAAPAPAARLAGAALTRAREGTLLTEEQKVVTPPAPPTGGSAETSSSGEITGPTPRAPLAQRAAARRDRRRRRRQELDTPSLPPATGSCPLDHCEGALSEAAELARREWEKVEQRLREWVGEQVYEIWFASAHAHLTDDGVLELAFADASKGTWVDGRYRVGIERRSGLPVRVVGCDRVRALSEVPS